MAFVLPRRSLRFASRFRASRALLFGAFLTMLVVVCFALQARAAAFSYEGFDYPADWPTTVWNGGTGFTGRWTEIQGQIADGSLSDLTQTLATAGNHADGTSMKRQIDFLSGEYWVSYLMRRSGSPSGPQSGGLLITGFEGFSGTYFIGEPGGGTGDNTLVIGSGDDNAYVSSGVAFEPGRDYFLVTHIEFAEGSDSATLYVNPTPGASAPSGGVAFTGTDFIPDLASFRFVSQGEGLASFDELRVGTTYAEVAPLVTDPTVPEPGMALGLFGALSTVALRARPVRRSCRG